MYPAGGVLPLVPFMFLYFIIFYPANGGSILFESIWRANVNILPQEAVLSRLCDKVTILLDNLSQYIVLCRIKVQKMMIMSCIALDKFYNIMIL